MSSYVRFEKRTGDRPKLSELSPEIQSIDGGRNVFQYFNDCFDTSDFTADTGNGGAIAAIAGNGGVIQLTGDDNSGSVATNSKLLFSPSFVGRVKWSARIRVVDSGSPALNRVHIGLFSDAVSVSAADRSFIKLISLNHGGSPQIGALLDFGQASGFPNDTVDAASAASLADSLEGFHVYSQELVFDGTNIKTLSSVDGVEIFEQQSTQADAGTTGMSWGVIGTAADSQIGMVGMKVDIDWLSIVGTRDV